jgi:predicted Zn-dependent protease
LIKEHFFELTEKLSRELAKDEILLCLLAGERSDFVRFNRGKVRQAGTVEQRAVTMRLVRDGRQAAMTLTTSEEDAYRAALRQLRDTLASLPQDPWLLINEEPTFTQSERRGTIAPAEAVVEQATRAAQGRDLVGIYAGGTIYRGFANSLGQRNWHEVDSFNFDWSLYLKGDQAVKSAYAGFDWDEALLHRKIDAAAGQLKFLELERQKIEPGEYRAYLAPKALEDLVGLLSWGGFSARARATKQSPLLRMDQGQKLSAKVSLVEKTREGVSAPFQGDGFVKPPAVTLIEQGRLADSLVSPRSAKEYKLQNNAANGGEAPESLDAAAGTLPEREALAALDDGLFISNLWYLNFSDRAAGRITGMTRFATFRVRGGRIAAPVSPMRFDDSIYRMLGDQLADLTSSRELLLDPSTYEARSTASARLPGALLSGLRFTL